MYRQAGRTALSYAADWELGKRNLSPQIAQFLTVSPGNAVRSESLLTTVQLLSEIAIAAIIRSMDPTGRPSRRISAKSRPYMRAASSVRGQTRNRCRCRLTRTRFLSRVSEFSIPPRNQRQPAGRSRSSLHWLELAWRAHERLDAGKCNPKQRSYREENASIEHLPQLVGPFIQSGFFEVSLGLASRLPLGFFRFSHF